MCVVRFVGILSDWVKKGFNFGRVQKRRLYGNDLINKNEKESQSVVWIKMKNENYFTIQFIFINIYEFYCIFLYYLGTSLYYFN